ncbi:nucleotidyltransferase domain-containing protein [uncultured Methanospirillum sp.]|uniref:nucleotidyltransferase domain-containing protein n=1 Tax=uncultured Methanospirillum sp. TaxID=262503 RepID=UPI0029C61DDC|nr:nucleotidyltransferase domain-containing protein [uncultured Methanospirillum sp.]
MQIQTSIQGLSEEQTECIRKILSSCSHLEKAVIFGSRAMGTNRPGSDIDIALFGDNLTIHDKISLMTRIDDLDLTYETDIIHVQSVTNQELLAHISRVGKVIYERSQ